MDNGKATQGELAEEMFDQMMQNGQSARKLEDEAEANSVREALRRLGRSARVQLRTARMGDVVVAARLDAAIWNDDTKTMRAKLTPPSAQTLQRSREG